MKTGHEVDLVLEDQRRRIVGIEVKATRHPTGEDLAGLTHLTTVAKGRLHRGFLLHLGEQVLWRVYVPLARPVYIAYGLDPRVDRATRASHLVRRL